MEVARYRAVTAVPPKTLDELRPRREGTSIALRCTLPSCPACKRFEATRAQYEQKLSSSRKVSHVVPWDCASEPHRALALKAGVKGVPAYVVIPHTGHIRVQHPS